MAKINILLSSKGGVGKSFVCNMLATYLMQQGRNPICIDTDNSTPIFSSFKKFDATLFNLLDSESGLLDGYLFNNLMSYLMGLGADDEVVIDTGASIYIDLIEYLLSNDPLSVLRDNGHDVVIHTILCGGSVANITIENIATLLNSFDGLPFVIWENSYHGKVGSQKTDKNGNVREIGFEDTSIFKNNKDRINALVKLPKWQGHYSIKAVEDLFAQHKTFLELDGIDIFIRNGLERKWNDMSNIISDCGL